MLKNGLFSEPLKWKVVLEKFKIKFDPRNFDHFSVSLTYFSLWRILRDPWLGSTAPYVSLTLDAPMWRSLKKSARMFRVLWNWPQDWFVNVKCYLENCALDITGFGNSILTFEFFPPFGQSLLWDLYYHWRGPIGKKLYIITL